jgi:hypothetical protein
MEKFLQKNFQNINKDLTIVKAVLIFKQLKHELYNWSQIVQLANRLFLMFALFFLLSAIFNFIIQGTPSIAGVSALSLNKHDLAVMTVDSPSLILGIYGIGILNALLAGALAVLGIIARSKLDLNLARVNLLILTAAPLVLGSLMIFSGVFNYLYMERAFQIKKAQHSNEYNEESH